MRAKTTVRELQEIKPIKQLIRFGDQSTLSSEHALIVSFDLENGAFGDENERNLINDVEDKLDAALSRSKAGEFDGNEYGDGECTMYMYGEDADLLLKIAEPILRVLPMRPLRITQRFGSAQDFDAEKRESRILG